MAIPVSAEIATVYRLLDNSPHHARCGRRLMVQGRSTEELHCSALLLPHVRRVGVAPALRTRAPGGR